jgi:hypothetical protein
MNDSARHSGTLDVSRLPRYAFSHRSPMWWGTMGMIAIEGTVFALVIVAYTYLLTVRADVDQSSGRPLRGTIDARPLPVQTSARAA